MGNDTPCPAGAAVNRGRKLVRTTLDYVQTQRSKYEGVIDEHFDAVEAHIQEMCDALFGPGDDKTQEARHGLDEARVRFQELHGQFERLRAENASAGGDIKKGLEEAATRFQDSLLTAADRFRSVRS